ncbi:MAG: DUF2871 domain-containing protein [Longicatena sp.]
MKKYLNIALGYAIAAMIGGVFYREFTKFNAFSGVSALGKVHTHLFLLGMVMFLIIALFATHFTLENEKKFRIFMVLYNIGVPLMSIMLVVRGICQVLMIELTTGANAAISGISGIAHILVGIAIVLFILSLKKLAQDQDA